MMHISIYRFFFNRKKSCENASFQHIKAVHHQNDNKNKMWDVEVI